jgi:hypothetical protein
LLYHENIEQKRLFFGLLNAIPTILAAYRLPKEVRSFYDSVRKYSLKGEKSLQNLETEEIHALQLIPNTGKI